MDRSIARINRPGHRALRQGRSVLAGQVYLLTFTTWRRVPHFARFDLACAASRAFARAFDCSRSRVLAWVLMPDHAHILLQLDETESPSLVVARIKSNASRELARHHPWRQRRWAPGFHDHALRREQSVLHAARYLVMNPVRAGLVAKVGDYPFWDCLWLEGRG